MLVYHRVIEGKPPFSYGFPMVFPLKPPFSYGKPPWNNDQVTVVLTVLRAAATRRAAASKWVKTLRAPG